MEKDGWYEFCGDNRPKLVKEEGMEGFVAQVSLAEQGNTETF